MQACFDWGFFYGFVSAVILGLILGRIQKAKGNIGQKNRPLDTFPDAFQPKTTPWSVVKKSIFSMIAWLFWALLFIALFIAICWFYPAVRMSLGCG